ncbi:hypothetical protein DKX38_023552 [Salix brachista]|uniref:DUF3741 domain-containing protein n=1 Tax=Salix brachista TaxID=2182728 RepID=A0A5N5JPK2_9ROSI|nr:hypothetical protein DKX38_023552 [Salix brachista]
MKGQDPSISSSSRRESSPAPEKIRSKSIGCMSGIFHLVYKYHNRRRLTFGKKHEKNRVSSPTTKPKQKPASSPSQPPPPLSSSSSSSTSTSLQHESKVFTRVSCGTVPRSPTLPAEIRRSKSLNSPERSRAPPALVARLMGLGDIPPMTTSDVAVSEKRRRLLGALEKCDEDLKALKKIIDVVKSSVAGTGKGADEEGRLEKGDEHPLLQQPSPVSVLDEFTPSSAFNGFSKRYTINARVPQQQKKKPGGEEVITNISFVDRIMTCENRVHGKSHGSVVSSHLWTSKAMIESVNEVCKDIAWGERREMGRIGLALQDYICRDLIEEIVKEMGFDCYNKIAPLPFESCKRRLHF